MCKCWKTYVLSAGAALAVGALSAFVSGGMGEGYGGLELPALAPPAWVFPVVWTILYILMGISAAMVWCSRSVPLAERSAAIKAYAVQLFLNFGWSILFFGMEQRLAAFFWLIALILAVMVMILRFSQISKPAALLQLPYLLWLFFAAYLNLSIYLLNR